MRRNLVILVCALCMMAHSVLGAEPIGPSLQKLSVNIAAGSSVQGSGTLVVVEIDKKPTVWALTAEHVVRRQKQTRDVVGPEGETRKQVSYKDVSVVQEQVMDGRTVGEIKYDARVVSVDPRRDIALLRIRADFTQVGVAFYMDDTIPQPGTPIFHCGAPGGKEIGGTATLTAGIVSRLGVRIPDFGGSEHGVFDQTDCASMGGSSGGMVALQSDGRYIGMITLGLQGGDSFNWIVPIRSIRDWANELKIPWLLDPKAERPTEEEIQAIPLELNPSGFTKSEPTPAPTPADGPGAHLKITP
jgi:S1-C subfamily serine protease